MDLILTLGHNASAILIEKENIVFGVESERLDKIKSSSSITPSLEFISENYKNQTIENLFISHWFDCFNLKDFNYGDKINKYLPKEVLKQFIFNHNIKNIYELNNIETHHIAHIYSSKSFLENQVNDKINLSNYHFLCIDGFGNIQETLTLAKFNENKL